MGSVPRSCGTSRDLTHVRGRCGSSGGQGRGRWLCKSLPRRLLSKGSRKPCQMRMLAGPSLPGGGGQPFSLVTASEAPSPSPVVWGLGASMR